METHSTQPSKTGKFVVISSPSGGGKTTVIGKLLKRNRDFTYSISATTRPPREGEIHGKSYYFYPQQEFLGRIERGEFLEWERVYGDYYGTPKAFAESAAAAGKIVLFDLDIKGALRFKQAHPDALLIFILPPSLEILEQRLRHRSSEDEAKLKRRLDEVGTEMEAAEKFDYKVVNDDLDATVRTIENIIRDKIQEDEPI